MHPRIKRESKTVKVMIELYCHKHHSSNNPQGRVPRVYPWVNVNLNKRSLNCKVPRACPWVSTGLCPECLNLIDYAQQRLEKCPFQEGKTICAKCLVHCYSPDMREKIRAIMRYSGPRMLFRHPIAAVWHLMDGRRKEQVYHLSERSEKGGMKSGNK